MLFLERSSRGHDFQMRYCNADGNQVEMCGNGARALSYDYHQRVGGEGQGSYTFATQNAVYFSKVQGDIVKVQMTELSDQGSIDISDLVEATLSYYINTGVPHCVYEVEHLDDFDVAGQGKKVRHDSRFQQGTNCDFFERIGRKIHIRTFERGVEAETLACGTGVVAVALSLYFSGDQRKVYECHTPGGEVWVEVESPECISLCGKVEKIFEGEFVLR